MDAREQEMRVLCERTVARLAEALPGDEIGCLLLFGDALRHLAHAGKFGLIFEIPREQGGVAWRTVEEGRAQRVPDVRADPDYLASDAGVRSEVTAPIAAAGEVVGVVDVEFASRVFEEREAALVEREAARLGEALAPYFS